jgi:hypothetical protein
VRRGSLARVIDQTKETSGPSERGQMHIWVILLDAPCSIKLVRDVLGQEHDISFTHDRGGGWGLFRG